MKTYDYVILGAGLGELSAAACLTRRRIDLSTKIRSSS